MSFTSALKREFIDRMKAWAEIHRPDIWLAASGDSLRAWAMIRELEGAAVFSENGHYGSGRLWLVVGETEVFGVVWAFDRGGTLRGLEWTGFDPLAEWKRRGRLTGGHRMHEQDEVQN